MQNSQSGCNAQDRTRPILIVEDDRILGNLLIEALQDDMPYQVSLAASAEKAIDMLQTITPVLCMLDYSLPKMNGLELVDYLQSQAETEHIPIILMSAMFPESMCLRKPIRRVRKLFDLEKLL